MANNDFANAVVRFNLLSARRSGLPLTVAYMAQLSVEIWRRGLFVPGVADVSLLDWHSSVPF